MTDSNITNYNEDIYNGGAIDVSETEENIKADIDKMNLAEINTELTDITQDIQEIEKDINDYNDMLKGKTPNKTKDQKILDKINDLTEKLKILNNVKQYMTEHKNKLTNTNIQQFNDLENKMIGIYNSHPELSFTQGYIKRSKNNNKNIATFQSFIPKLEQYVFNTKNATTFISAYPNYKDLDKAGRKEDKRFVDDVLAQKIFTKDELLKALKDNEFVIKKTINVNKNINNIINITYDDVINIYKSDMRSNNTEHRKNVNLENNELTDNKYAKIVSITLKKITNIIINLNDMAKDLTATNFNGSTYADNNTIKNLYDDIGDKIYITVKAYNNQNQQIIKLDDEFKKLYSITMRGLNSFQPAVSSYVGGNLKIPNNYIYTPVSHKTIYPHLL